MGTYNGFRNGDFVGIILKIILQDLNVGGYTAYREHNIAYTRDIMTKGRFKQIRTAFRLDSGKSTIGNKWHQLQYVINKFNQSIRSTFIPGYDMSFNKGGNASRSRYNPAR